MSHVPRNQPQIGSVSARRARRGFDELFARMQSTKVRRAMTTAFVASGNPLGKAAVDALPTRGK